MSTQSEGTTGNESSDSRANTSGNESKRTWWIIGAVALACLVVGGIGGFLLSGATSEESGADAESPIERLAEITDDATARSATQTPTTSDLSPTEIALFNRIPASDRPCEAIGPDSSVLGLTAQIVCREQDVQVLYEQYDSTVALRGEYQAILNELGIQEGQTPTPCPNTVPSDSAIERNGVTTGRLVCFETEGVQLTAWTSEPLNVLVVAQGDGMSAIALHEWWQQTDRPILTDDEVTFYASVPEGHRAACDFGFVSFSEVQSVPAPERGSTALCFLPSTNSPEDPENNMGVVYMKHYSSEAMYAEYEAIKTRWGVTPDAGDCQQNPPGEGAWKQGEKTAGRLACALVENSGETSPVMWWTTDPVNILSTAIAASDMTMSDLWDWWANESGPVFRKS